MLQSTALKVSLLSIGLVACLSAVAVGAPQFDAPVQMKAAGQVVRVEAPGYASPCWADVDGDGKKDLVVGQFSKGKMKVYRNLGEGKLAEGEWLQAEGSTAEVPGVW